MYLKVGDSLLNMNNVDFVNRIYSETTFEIMITFASGAYVRNSFETQEEAELLFDTIRIRLDAMSVD